MLIHLGPTDKKSADPVKLFNTMSNRDSQELLNKSPCYWLNKDTLRLTIYVQPNASLDEIVGMHGTRIKIRLKALPINGEANQQLIKYLAKCFKIKKLQIKICIGNGSRNKLLEIKGVDKIPKQFQCNEYFI